MLVLPALACSFSVDLGDETAEPTVPAPSASTPTPVPAPVLYEDDFSNPGSGWAQSELDDGAAGYRDGIYYMASLTEGFTL